MLRLACILAVFLASFSTVAAAPEWQYSVPAPSIEGRRAFLWIPPACPRIRGLVIACHNMIEKALFERPEFRAAAAENGLGLLLIYSGHDKGPDDDKNPDHPQRTALDIFLNPTYPKGDEDPKGAGEDLQKILDALAKESGYPEIRHAPLLPVGHSSAGSFVWHLARWDASRIFAMLPFKTGAKDDGPEGIPVLEVNSEWFDYGGASNRCWSPDGPGDGRVRARNNGKCLYGYYVDIGSGHCNVSDDSLKVFALFLRKAVAARIPANAPLDGPVPLKPIAPESGWLLDPSTIGKPGGKPIAYAAWKEAPDHALWYIDREMAAAVQDHMARQLAKKPQQIGFLRDGVPVAEGGTFTFAPKFLADGATFEIGAAFVDHLDKSDLYPPGTKLGHGRTPILYRVNSGGVTQVGPNRFRVCPLPGPLLPQGNPWEPTLVAYTLGDETYRPAEKPAHVVVNIINKEGAPQTLDFPNLPDQQFGRLAPMKLRASASSGLPVQFFMVSGPAEIAGDTLRFTKIPERSKFPVRVLVAAFQWGRPADPKVASVGPEIREFWIRR